MTPVQIQSLAASAILAMLFGVLAGSIIEWSKWIARNWNGTKPNGLPLGPQRTVGLIDLLVTFLVLVMLFFIAAISWRALGLPVGLSGDESKRAVSSVADSGGTEAGAGLESNDLASANNIDSVVKKSGGNSEKSIANKPKVMTQTQFIYSGFAMSAQVLCVILMTVVICSRTGCSPKSLGWRLDQIPGDLQAGLRCFLMMTPIILVMNAVLQGVTKTPYEHPVQEMIKLYPWLLGIAFWQAAIVAPISEEFGFRVLLIGWFESIHFGKDKLSSFFFGSVAESQVQEANVIASSDLSLAKHDPNPYSAPAGEPAAMNEGVGGDERANSTSLNDSNAYRAPWWPTWLSGTLFGLAHFSYGVSWVPLIVFGVVLGRLYQTRQSVIPGILVHFLFNAMNVALLGLSLLAPKAAG